MAQIHKINMFTRARLKMPLFPSEQAFLEFLWGIVPSALIAGGLAAVPFLETQKVNWSLTAIAFVVAMMVNVFNTLRSYFAARGDTTLATLFADLGKALSAATPTSSPIPAPVASPAANLGAVTAAPATDTPAPVTVTTAPVSNI